MEKTQPASSPPPEQKLEKQISVDFKKVEDLEKLVHECANRLKKQQKIKDNLKRNKSAKQTKKSKNFYKD